MSILYIYKKNILRKIVFLMQFCPPSQVHSPAKSKQKHFKNPNKSFYVRTNVTKHSKGSTQLIFWWFRHSFQLVSYYLNNSKLRVFKIHFFWQKHKKFFSANLQSQQKSDFLPVNRFPKKAVFLGGGGVLGRTPLLITYAFGLQLPTEKWRVTNQFKPGMNILMNNKTLCSCVPAE